MHALMQLSMNSMHALMQLSINSQICCSEIDMYDQQNKKITTWLHNWSTTAKYEFNK
jgi:hypothetical protein